MAGPSVRLSNADFFLARAEQARVEGEAATLDHVRERCRRSQAAWTALAERAQRGAHHEQREDARDRGDHLDNKKNELNGILAESQEEEKRLLAEREKATKKIEDKILKYYERLRKSLSNGLAVVRVVRGAAEGCNIVIPPQKIAEIREKKKIVIDEHSGRILADVDMDSLDEGDKPKSAKIAMPPPTRRKKVE